MKQLFEGTGVALVTPFKNGGIDFKGTKKLIDRGIALGIKAFFILATTGEGVTISDKEREKFIRFCIKENAGRGKIIVGTGHNDFQRCVFLTQQAKRLGADGVLVVTPYYNKTTQTGIINYYQMLAQIQIPMIIYNVPSRTGMNIDIQTLDTIISTNDYVWGIKESEGDIARIKKICKLCRGRVSVYSGEDDLNYLFYCLGGQGCVSVTANAYPDKVQQVYNLVKNGRFEDALLCQEKLDIINEAMFYEVNPIPIKYYLSLMGLISPHTRMPLVEMSDKNKKKIEEVYKTFNLTEKNKNM